MRRRFLTQNSELRDDGIWNFSLPAWVTRLPNGDTVNVCPQAGACVKLCYARNGTYLFPGVQEAHQRNLELVRRDMNAWTTVMHAELAERRFRPTGATRLPDLPRSHLTPHVAALLDHGAAAVRIHDSGDFFSPDYLLAWILIAELTPDVLFYAYTKEVALMRRVASPTAPANFQWIYSLGGKQDHLINLDTERHADVFPTPEAIAAAGYYDQSANDLLCVTAPSHRIGIPTNHIPHFQRAQGDATFGELEAGTRRRRLELA